MKVSIGPGLLLALLAAAPAAAQNDCGSAREDYGSAIEEMSRVMHLYGRCIDQSGGRTDCALEFKQIEKAQKRIEEAVMQIGFRCRAERQGKFGDQDSEPPPH